jgi:hypothetical protein
VSVRRRALLSSLVVRLKGYVNIFLKVLRESFQKELTKEDS